MTNKVEIITHRDDGHSKYRSLVTVTEAEQILAELPALIAKAKRANALESASYLRDSTGYKWVPSTKVEGNWVCVKWPDGTSFLGVTPESHGKTLADLVANWGPLEAFTAETRVVETSLGIIKD